MRAQLHHFFIYLSSVCLKLCYFDGEVHLTVRAFAKTCNLALVLEATVHIGFMIPNSFNSSSIFMHSSFICILYVVYVDLILLHSLGFTGSWISLLQYYFACFPVAINSYLTVRSVLIGQTWK